MNSSERASATYEAMRHYMARWPHLYRVRYPAWPLAPYASEWDFVNAVGLALDLARLSASYESVARTHLWGLGRYWDGRPHWGLPGHRSSTGLRAHTGGGDKYHDDNAWAGLALVRGYRMLGDVQALARALATLDFIAAGWDEQKGGIYWKQQTPWETNHDRNTCSTAPSAELALRLHAITEAPGHLQWAVRWYGWVVERLRDPQDGLYWDHVAREKTGAERVDKTKWSYNQGTMIGAGVLLHRATSDPEGSYLRQAEATAWAALRYYAGRYARQDVAFNAIFGRNLLLLSTATGEAELRRAILEALHGYADWAWTTVRDPATGLHWFHRDSGHVNLIDQAAIGEVYACLAWPPEAYDLLV